MVAAAGSWSGGLAGGVDRHALHRAERALFERAGLACTAAAQTSTIGRFRVWEQGGVFAVLATDPALAFLSTVSGVTAETAPAAISLARATVWNGLAPTVVVSLSAGGGQPGDRSPDDGPRGRGVEAVLRTAGLIRGPDRVLAIRDLAQAATPGAPPPGEVRAAADGADFLRVLLQGYGVAGPVATFIAAEHAHPAVRRFLAYDHDTTHDTTPRRDTPVAAGAMTLHHDVAVLGGASTLPAHRGRGAQAALLDCRLRRAAEAGCTLAVATARSGSASAANLRRAGFRLHRRTTWTHPGPSVPGRA